MIGLGVADLVVIASRTLGVDIDRALDLLDPAAAERALAQGGSGASEDPASRAAVLLHALVRHRPLRRGNQRVALAAMLQFLALNGWDADLPPEATRDVLAEVAAGGLATGDVAAWLAPRLRPSDREATCPKEASMRRWLPVPTRRRRGGLFQRFTDRARRAVQLAQDEARRLDHNYIGTEHVLLGLISEGDGVAAKALGSLGISLAEVRAQVEEIIGRGQTAPSGHIPFTPRAKKVLDLSLREAIQLGHNYIGTEHILLGLVREGQGLAAQILTGFDVTHARIREQVLRLLTGGAGRRARERMRLVHMTVPADLAEIEEELARVRGKKEAAIDAGDPDTAAVLRDRERQLLADVLRREQEWEANVDVQAVIEENRRVHRELDHLRELLRQHGIEPDGGTARSA